MRGYAENCTKPWSLIHSKTVFWELPSFPHTEHPRDNSERGVVPGGVLTVNALFYKQCHLSCCLLWGRNVHFCTRKMCILYVRESANLGTELSAHRLSYYKRNLQTVEPMNYLKLTVKCRDLSFGESSEPFIKSSEHLPAFQKIKNCVFNSSLSSLRLHLLFVIVIHSFLPSLDCCGIQIS